MNMLDLAMEARKKGKIFNPMFTGEAGLGKSEICQTWVKKQRETNPNFGFIDLRIAYMEAPDLIGFPETEKDKNGVMRTKHRLPEFWPTEGSGLLLLEEPNRGTTGVMNCLMQLLTDRKLHNYTLPEGWIVAACVNPDSAEYDVNAMDQALRDRFREFEVEFDHVSFSDFISTNGWDEKVIGFVDSGMWVYKDSKNIGKEGKYISPRTFAALNAAEVAGARTHRGIHRMVVQSILGKHYGKEYHEYCYDQSPVTAQDLLKDEKNALKRLREQSKPGATYAGDMISQTIESIIKHYGGFKKDCKEDQINEDLMVEVARIIPPDLGINLVKECGFKQTKGKVIDFFKEFVKRHPDMAERLKQNLRVNRANSSTDK